MAPPLPAHGVHRAVFSKKSVFNIKAGGWEEGIDPEQSACEKKFLCRQFKCAGPRHVGELAHGFSDPVPSRLSVVIVLRRHAALTGWHHLTVTRIVKGRSGCLAKVR
jgi:hypothetical protein